MPCSTSQRASSGWSEGPWPQMPTYLPCDLQALMAMPMSSLHRLVALIEELGDDPRIAIETERELGHVVRADGHAVEVLEIALGEHGVGRQLAHHDVLQAVLPALQAVVASSCVTAFASASVRTKGTMICTFVRPISSRTRLSARHSSSKHGRKTLSM